MKIPSIFSRSSYQDIFNYGEYQDYRTILVTFLFSTIFLFFKSILFSQPYIMTDELAYKWASHSYFLHDTFYYYGSDRIGCLTNITNYLYQLIISPAFYFNDNFLVAIKLINSIMVSTAVFPIYLLSKEFVSKWKAIAIVILTILLPENNYVINVLAENLYFPLFIFTFFFFYKFIISNRCLYIVLATLSLVLLFMTKPHGLVFICVFELYFLYRFIRAIATKSTFLIGKTIHWVIIHTALFISVLIISRSYSEGMFFYKFWDLGIYNTMLEQNSVFIFSDFISMVVAHVTSLSIVYSVPILMCVYFLFTHRKTKSDNLYYLNILTLFLFAVLLLMVIKFTHTISCHEHYFRLHARYYYMIFPVLILSFFANSSKIIRMNKKFLFWTILLLLMIMFGQYHVLYKEYAENIGFVSDNPGVCWLFLIRDYPSVVIMVIATSTLMPIIVFTNKKYGTYFYYVFIIVFYIFSSISHISMANRYHHKNSLEVYNTTKFLISNIDFSKRTMVIDSGFMNRTNLLFWLNNPPEKVLQLPKNTLLNMTHLTKNIDRLILLDKYNFSDINYKLSKAMHTIQGKEIDILYFN